MQPTVFVYKPRCLTPLQTIHLFQEQHPEYAGIKISYAGRLDPMAEGLLILLIGNENKKRHLYETLQKTYQFELLPGFTTDTYDILGIVTGYSKKPLDSVADSVREKISSLPGNYLQSFPPYSSQPVNGKPLFWWARNNLLHTITIPRKPITITDASILEKKTISSSALQTIISRDLVKVIGDFRQSTVISQWEKVLSGLPAMSYPVFVCKVTCSSGTYIRSLVHSLGQELGCGAITLRIIRTGIGKTLLKNADPVRIL